MKNLLDFTPYCSLDPISITALLIGGLAGAASSGAFSSGGGSNQAAPATPTDPTVTPSAMASAPPAAAPITNPAKNRNITPSFIGSASVPDNQSFGTKTLLGQ